MFRVTSCCLLGLSFSHLAEVAGGNFHCEVDSREERQRLEVEYLLLALDFGEILFLFAGFWSLQAALLQVFEPSCNSRTLRRTRRISAVLWDQKRGRHLNNILESFKLRVGLRELLEAVLGASDSILDAQCVQDCHGKIWF